MTELTNTNIDTDSIKAELEADLQNRESFKSLFPGETGKLLTEQGAALAALQLYHIHSATQNSFFPTAFSKSAVYALAASLGHPPTRKLGAQTTLEVTINSTLTSDITLPKFSRFSARGLEWYTIQDEIITTLDTSVTLQVRQGERVSVTTQGTGKDNQRIEIGEDFDVDENFLVVEVDGTEYTSNGFSLLNTSQGDLVYAEQTASNGRVIILFGNTILGSIPAVGVDITISYSNTVGAPSNSAITGDTFQYIDQFDLGGSVFLELTGVSITSSSGGANEETVQQVKTTAPRLFAANQRAVRRDDYIGHILTSTGAFAAKAWGEYEEATQKGYADLTMMNRAYVTAIPNTLQDGSNTLATGDGILLNFAGIIDTNLIPGSIIINSSNAVWRDFDGKGLLLSPSVSFNAVSGGTPSATENPGTSSNAWDGNLASDWSSTSQPQPANPIRLSYDFGIGNEIIPRSFRFSSSADPLITTRGFPKQVILLASNVASPNLSTRDDWTVIRGSLLLDEPGYQSYSRWIPVDDSSSLTAYRHFAVEILDVHSQAPVVKISNIEIQSNSNSSTVDYESGAYNLDYSVAPTGDIISDYLNGNFSSAQKTDLINTLNSLNHFTTLVNYRNSVGVPIDVVATVRHLEGFEANTVLASVQTAVDDLFVIQSDSIGKPLYLSDIYQAIQDVTGVDYCILSAPTLDRIIEIDQYVYLNSRSIAILPTDR